MSGIFTLEANINDRRIYDEKLTFNGKSKIAFVFLGHKSSCGYLNEYTYSINRKTPERL
jgi:hypothetical protein